MHVKGSRRRAPKSSGRIVFFETAAAFRDWLKLNHADKSELILGFRKIGTGKPSLTWPEAIQEAIAFGWIDGIRHSIDAESYTVRFTPRKRDSVWSLVNVATAKRLVAQGLMAPAGLDAFQARRDDRSAIYSYEQRKNPKFSTDEITQLRLNSAAWKHFQSRPPSYQRLATWWVISAKMRETRARRLAQLIECSAKGRPVPPLVPRAGKS
ncbi:YdeI/OmpD-associated family protein [Candidatus Bathyarchaeota archaeon]|nr:YdeI/OmpD-associated family protein [Candidatus Bathyarchaeota archaeon]